MSDPSPPKDTDVSVLQLLPNLLTVAAICAGISAIRFGYEGNFELAVRLILAACILDGLDGRVARMMNSSSPIGAELDSLADFVNFGVAPVLILHSWAFPEFRNEGWIAVLCYSICCVLRLARFNVSNRTEADMPASTFFVGVPSPAGAVLVLLPMIVTFAAFGISSVPPVFVGIYMCLIGLLMISRLPTYSFKNLFIGRGSARFFLLGAGLLAAALLTYLWETLTLISIAYAVSIIWAVWAARSTAASK